MKKTLILFSLLLSLFLYSCSFFELEPKDFIYDDIQITLDESFKENEEEKNCFISYYTVVVITHETFEYPLTIKEYCSDVLKANNKESEVNECEEGLIPFAYATYSSVVNDIEYSYLLVCVKKNDTYYCINFATTTNLFEDKYESFFNWAKQIKFTS